MIADDDNRIIGDAKSTAQQLPPDSRYPQRPHPGSAGQAGVGESQNKSILQSAQETVSKALGGGGGGRGGGETGE